jgi:hypothetical protein
MDPNRRTFIRRSLVVLGSVATGAAGAVAGRRATADPVAAAEGQANAQAGMPAACHSDAPITSSLTPDHQPVS